MPRMAWMEFVSSRERTVVIAGVDRVLMYDSREREVRSVFLESLRIVAWVMLISGWVVGFRPMSINRTVAWDWASRVDFV